MEEAETARANRINRRADSDICFRSQIRKETLGEKEGTGL